jgi:hypothetical protein
MSFDLQSLERQKRSRLRPGTLSTTEMGKETGLSLSLGHLKTSTIFPGLLEVGMHLCHRKNDSEEFTDKRNLDTNQPDLNERHSTEIPGSSAYIFWDQGGIFIFFSL